MKKFMVTLTSDQRFDLENILIDRHNQNIAVGKDNEVINELLLAIGERAVDLDAQVKRMAAHGSDRQAKLAETKKQAILRLQDPK